MLNPQFYKNLSVGQKMASIVLLVIVGFASVAYTFHSLRTNQQAVEQQDNVTREFSSLVSSIDHEFLEVNNHELEFLISKDATEIQNSKNSLSRIYGMLDKALSISADEKIKSILLDLTEMAQGYDAALQSLLSASTQLGLDHNTGLHGLLRKAVHDVEDTLKAHNEIILSHSMLLMRRHEKDYMARKLDKYVGKMESEQTRFAQLLVESNLSSSQRDLVASRMKEYYNTFLLLPTIESEVKDKKEQLVLAAHNSSGMMNKLLVARDSHIESSHAIAESKYADLTRNFYIFTSGIMVVVSLMLILFSRYLTRSIRSAMKVAEAVAGGNLDNDIKVTSDDETGKLLGSLKTMQSNLKSRIDAELRAAEEVGRIKQALDGVSGNVMIADVDSRIIYMNDALVGMMTQVERDIRQEAPSFDVSSLMGSCLKDFQTGASTSGVFDVEQTGSYTKSFIVGDISMSVTVSPVFDESRNRIGTVVEWLNRTSEVAIEDEIQSIVDGALHGDLSQRIGLDGKNGFFATLSQSVNSLVTVSEQVVNEMVTVLSSMARGDLTRTIDAKYDGTYDELKNHTNSTLSKLTEVMDDIRSNSNNVLALSSEIADGNNYLSERTEEQASRLLDTASSMEQMTSTVVQNAGSAKEADGFAISAREEAQKGRVVIKNAVVAMGGITDSSKKISDIIRVIDDIAFQTNLLALNAAVEAARAGEQGRGFAVVATEVRNLAGRSAIAAKEIKVLIQESVVKVEEGSTLVNQSGETLEGIMNSITKVSDIIGQIAVASREQSDGIELVNNAIAKIDEITQQNSQLVKQAATSSESMGGMAKELNNVVEFFSTNLGRRNHVEALHSVRPTVTNKQYGFG